MVLNEKLLAEYDYHSTVTGLKVTECFLVIGSLLFLRLYVSILLTRQFCHPNMQMMLILQPVAHACGLSIRIVRHFLEFMNVLNNTTVTVTNFLADCGISTAAEVMFIMGIERVYAMYKVDTYEEDSSRKMGNFLCISLLFTMYVLMALWYAQLMPSALVYTLCYSMMFVTAVIFIILPFVCNTAYKKVATQRYSTVSQRFRTARTLQAAQLLMYLSPYKCISSLVSLTCYIYIFHYSKDRIRPLLAEIYMVTNVAQLTCQMLLTLSLHGSLHREFVSRIRFKKNSVSTRQEVKSVAGQRMMFTITEEQDMHFRALHNEWNKEVALKPNEHKATVTEARQKAYVTGSGTQEEGEEQKQEEP